MLLCFENSFYFVAWGNEHMLIIKKYFNFLIGEQKNIKIKK